MSTLQNAAIFTELANDQLPGADDLKPHEFTLAVKANIAVAGFRLSAASPVLERFVAPVDAPVVTAFRGAGANVVGTTNMHELAFGITSTNPAFGNVEIPTHPGRSAGGSSGGSAAAVAGGFVDLAIGTDTGGSVSLPASVCGVVGFRPSTGRWPTANCVGLSWTRDTPGVFTRTVEEVQRADYWVTNERAQPVDASRRRIGIPHQLLRDLAPAVESAFSGALDRMREDYDIVELDFADVLTFTDAAEMPIVLYESKQLLSVAAANALGMEQHAAFAALVEGTASPDVRGILESVQQNPTSADEYTAAMAATYSARSAYNELLAMNNLDAVAIPSAPATAAPLGVGEMIEHLGKDTSTFGLYTRNTGQGTMLGVPMLTIPAEVPEGSLPVGFTLQGLRFGDTALLELGARLERLIRGT